MSNLAAATLNVEGEKDEFHHNFSDFPHSAVDDDDNEAETDETELLKKKKNPAWSFAYYQEFFDIDTTMVLSRIKSSLIPHPSYSLNRTNIKGQPDMYGPFWICATLVMCIGVLSNLTNFITNLSNLEYHYKPQFQLLPIAASVIYFYCFIFPLFIKLLFWWRKNAVGCTVSQIICIYGYSLFILIPASFLFLVPYDAFDWVVVACSICLSGIVIMVSLWPAFSNDDKKLAGLLLFILFGVHAAMIVLLKLYFFTFSSSHSGTNNSNTTHNPIVTTITTATSLNI